MSVFFICFGLLHLLCHAFSLLFLSNRIAAHVDRAIHGLDADKKLEFDFNSATSRISASMHPMGIGLRGGEGNILSPIDLYCIAQSSMNAHNALLGIPKEEVDGKLVQSAHGNWNILIFFQALIFHGRPKF